MNICEVQTIDRLQDYRSVWQSLLLETPCANFFQTFDWLEAYWRHFGVEQQLRVLIVTEGDAVTGILPLVLRTEQTKVGSLRFATYPMDHWGSFYGPIGANPDAVLAAGLDYLCSQQSDWDVLEPRWIGAESGECERVEALLSAAGNSPIRSELDATAIIDLQGSWDDYLASRDGKWRNNTRRWERQLSKLGEINHKRHRPDADYEVDAGWEYYEECSRIAARSWQASSTTGTTLTHESVSAFLRDVHLAAAKCGCLDMNLLQVDGRAIAFTYNYAFNGNVFSLRSGFDPYCPVKGAGSLLYVKTIEDSFRRGDWQYDLGPRHLKCKRKLLTHVLPVYRVSCFKRWSLRQQLIRIKRNLEAAPLALNQGEAAASST